jgi:hypothetical protein
LVWAGVNPTVRNKLGTLQDRRAAIDTRESAGSGQRRMQRQWPPRWQHGASRMPSAARGAVARCG